MVLAASTVSHGQRGGSRKKPAAQAAVAAANALATPTEAQCREEIDYCFNRHCFDPKTMENGAYTKCGSQGAAMLALSLEEDCLKTRGAVKSLDLVPGCKQWTFNALVPLLENKGQAEKSIRRNTRECANAMNAVAAARKCHALMLAHDGSIDLSLEGRLDALCGRGAGGSGEMVSRFLHAGDYGEANIGAQRDMLLTSQNTAKRDNWRQAVDIVLAGYVETAKSPCGGEDFELVKVGDYLPDSRDNLEMIRAKSAADQAGRGIADKIVGRFFAQDDCLKRALPEGGERWTYQKGRNPDCRIECEYGFRPEGSDDCVEEVPDVPGFSMGALIGVNTGTNFDNRISDAPALGGGHSGGSGGGYGSGGGHGVGAMVSGAAYSTGGRYGVTIDPNWKDEHSVAYIGVQKGVSVCDCTGQCGCSCDPTAKPCERISTPAASGVSAASDSKGTAAAATDCGKAYARANADREKKCAGTKCTKDEICSMVAGKSVVGNYEGIACFGTSSAAKDSWYAVPGGGSFHDELKGIFAGEGGYTGKTREAATAYLEEKCQGVVPPAENDPNAAGDKICEHPEINDTNFESWLSTQMHKAKTVSGGGWTINNIKVDENYTFSVTAYDYALKGGSTPGSRIAMPPDRKRAMDLVKKFRDYLCSLANAGDGAKVYGDTEKVKNACESNLKGKRTEIQYCNQYMAVHFCKDFEDLDKCLGLMFKNLGKGCRPVFDACFYKDNFMQHCPWSSSFVAGSCSSTVCSTSGENLVCDGVVISPRYDKNVW